ncbi:MAG: hypothetical protein GYA47_11725 [Desulfovibrio sp.]|nr:hypothetical protein [Desulfovibrio sp.]
MSHVRGFAVFPLFFFMLFLALPPGRLEAQEAGDEPRPVSSGTEVSGVIQEEYGEGLFLVADDGALYLVITPEEVSLEEEEAFHLKNKGARVTLIGDVYRDAEGALSIVVYGLP